MRKWTGPFLVLLVFHSIPVAHADPDPSGMRSSQASEGEDQDEHDDGDIDPATLRSERTRVRRLSTARFSDGPRNVPTPRGASMLRAQSLGLGTRECAQTLLHGVPEERWISGAGSTPPSRLLFPVDDGRWVRGFGYVRTTRPGLLHRGVDIAADQGTVIRAAADGIVAYSDNGVHGYGNLIILLHANGWMTLYAHASRTTVQPGYRVHRGERIGLVGQTGIAHGPHLHFELWKDGRPLNPTALFDGGPTFVRRIAEQAVRRGRVPPVGQWSAWIPEPSLDENAARTSPPVTDTARATASTAPVQTAPVPVSAPRPPARRAQANANVWEQVRALIHEGASPELLSAMPARAFSTLLFPLRRGTIAAPFYNAQRPMRLVAENDAAVRAPADARVVFAGTVERGSAAMVVLLHHNGAFTRLTGLRDVAVREGEDVLRGAWIGHGSSVDFAYYENGHSVDPQPRLVAPASPLEASQVVASR